MNTVAAATLKAWLHDGAEIAFLDLREHGQYGEEHPLMVVSLPYSQIERKVTQLLPNPAVRVVVMDDGRMAVAEAACALLGHYGYANVWALEQGIEGWRAAGYGLFAGVNVYSKAFGELAGECEDVPQITADALHAELQAGADLVVIDGRPIPEYRKMNIPGSICCPNGELALRIGQIVDNPDTKIVINCAGRTRSIIGAATLRRFGIPNPVVALKNGTMGWRLAGYELHHGSDRLYPDLPESLDRAAVQGRALEIATARALPVVTTDMLASMRADPARTTYVLDVRTAAEFEAGHVAGSVWAPGGQLVQATDEWIGVRNARVVLTDDLALRAVMTGLWLRDLGWDIAVLTPDAAFDARQILPSPLEGLIPALPEIAPRDLVGSKLTLIDIRSGMSYRQGHIDGANWLIRPNFARADLQGKTLCLVGDDAIVTRAAARDLGALGCTVAGMVLGNAKVWQEAGLSVVATPDLPADDDCIDFLFFVHDRHDGNNEAARRYLSWELDLLAKLDADELRQYRLLHPAH